MLPSAQRALASPCGRCRPSWKSSRALLRWSSPIPSGSPSSMRGRRVGRHRVDERLVVVGVGQLGFVADRLPDRRAPPGSSGPSPRCPPATSRPRRGPPASLARRRGSSCDQSAGVHGLEPAARLGQVAVLLPEPPHRERQADRGRSGPSAAHRPIEDGPDVVMLEFESVQPATLIGARKLRRRPRSASATNQSRWRSRMAAVSPRAPSCSTAYSRIVSRSRKRGSPSGASSTLTRLWSASAISPSSRSPPSSADGPQTASTDVEVAAAGEDRQPVEQQPAAVVEQVVAPGDGATERLLARRQVARAGGQDVELVLQAGEDRVGRQELDPGRGKLDRQGHPVEPRADRGDGRGVVVGHGEARPDRERPAR